ncbi:hypothetical protein ZYGR_0AG05460 [Zygosaccharomyces rouxii]|uniref:Uncharacterized protein n=1 Tax=Zygosaccharomyces rouxii TaxID=4956 RepID=A0A1Q3AA37_ZYGRO|nr:hypothetical protein ZYGR_0AG05460 [Zygosaccharomyces rouxii]
MTETYDHDEAYKRTQSQIYGLQDTILNSTKSSILKKNKGENRGRASAAGATATTVDSKPVLEYAYSKFGEPKTIVGSFKYHAFKEARRETESMPFPFDLYELAAPRPFLPGYGSDMINQLVEVKISYEDLRSSVQVKDSPRTMNNEIWGADIHTDDSDPILVLRHCGLSLDDANGTCRTPANLHNPDNILGTVPPAGTPFDIEVQLLLLPPLQKYTSLRRYGITSRQWGDGASAPHDGLSYGIYSIKILPRDKSTDNVKEKDQKVNIADWS